MTAGPTLHQAAFGDLAPARLFTILRLRLDTFVVEQDCPYPELDGRDAEPGAIHAWIASGGAVVATARYLSETVDGRPTGRIGRIATAPAARGAGLAGQLIAAGIEHFGGLPVVLGAQCQLEAYYGRFGFERSGPDYDEDGIPHLPMRREPGPGEASP